MVHGQVAPSRAVRGEAVRVATAGADLLATTTIDAVVAVAARPITLAEAVGLVAFVLFVVIHTLL